MTQWSRDALRKIAEADDLHISPFREDWGLTVRRRGSGPSTMRSTCAPTMGRILVGTVRQKAGRITAAGMAKEVTFARSAGQINDRIDEAYRAKYYRSPYLTPMIGARARSATVKVMLRETNACSPSTHDRQHLNPRERL